MSSFERSTGPAPDANIALMIENIQMFTARLTEMLNCIRTMESVLRSQLTTSRRFNLNPQNGFQNGFQRRVHLYSRIRSVTNQLFGIYEDSQIFEAVRLGYFVTEQEKETIERSEQPVPMASLKPYWNVIRCRYNQMLAERFAHHFIGLYPENINDRREIAAYFLLRLERLGKIVKRSISLDTARIADEDRDE